MVCPQGGRTVVLGLAVRADCPGLGNMRVANVIGAPTRQISQAQLSFGNLASWCMT